MHSFRAHTAESFLSFPTYALQRAATGGLDDNADNLEYAGHGAHDHCRARSGLNA